MRELLEKGDIALNVVVRGGDVIHIQERLPQTVYVIGEVNRAGAYQLPPKQELRVSQMFAWAGGPMKTAKMSEGILLRYNAQGERQELPVNFAEILKGRRKTSWSGRTTLFSCRGARPRALATACWASCRESISSIPWVVIP